MSDHEKVFVICENKCFEEGMTKEQILEEGKFVTDPVTEIKHKTRWLSKAQYEALDGNYEPNTEYHVYDEEYFVAHAERAEESDVAINVTERINGININDIFKRNNGLMTSVVKNADKSKSISFYNATSQTGMLLTTTYQQYNQAVPDGFNLFILNFSLIITGNTHNCQITFFGFDFNEYYFILPTSSDALTSVYVKLNGNHLELKKTYGIQCTFKGFYCIPLYPTSSGNLIGEEF